MKPVMRAMPYDNAREGSLRVQLGADRYFALASYITEKAATLDVPMDFEMPQMHFLEDCRATLGGDFRQGGMGWPDRYVMWIGA